MQSEMLRREQVLKAQFEEELQRRIQLIELERQQLQSQEQILQVVEADPSANVDMDSSSRQHS